MWHHSATLMENQDVDTMVDTPHDPDTEQTNPCLILVISIIGLDGDKYQFDVIGRWQNAGPSSVVGKYWMKGLVGG